MPCKVAIVGASSLTGREILKTLAERSFPLSQIRLFETTSGQHLNYDNSEILIEEVSEHALREGKFRIVFFAGGVNTAKQYIASAEGALVVDTSFYAYHLLKAPLVVSDIVDFPKEQKVVANPCCLAVQLSRVLHPILKKSMIKRVIASTYQSVAGAGFFGIEELERQVSEIENGKEASMHYFDKQIAFNVIPQINDFYDEWTKEELAIPTEVGKVLGIDDLNMSVTCVRVPVIRGHSASVMIELEDELTDGDFYHLWQEAGLSVYKDDYPTPWELEGTIDIGVARLRKDRHIPRCYHFWTVADNLSACMALNSVQIAENYIKL